MLQRSDSSQFIFDLHRFCVDGECLEDNPAIQLLGVDERILYTIDRHEYKSVREFSKHLCNKWSEKGAETFRNSNEPLSYKDLVSLLTEENRVSLVSLYPSLYSMLDGSLESCFDPKSVDAFCNRITLNTTNTLEFQEKKNITELHHLVDTFKKVAQKLNATSDEAEVSVLRLQFFDLRNQIIKLFILNHSTPFIEARQHTFDVAPLVCVLRDPFEKMMMSFLLSSVSGSQYNVDHLYVFTLAMIRKYYVLAIYEIMLLLYFFVNTNCFGMFGLMVFISYLGST